MRLIMKFITDGGIAALVCLLMLRIVLAIFLGGSLSTIVANISNSFLG